jgi:hypothetical protein
VASPVADAAGLGVPLAGGAVGLRLGVRVRAPTGVRVALAFGDAAGDALTDGLTVTVAAGGLGEAVALAAAVRDGVALAVRVEEGVSVPLTVAEGDALRLAVADGPDVCVGLPDGVGLGLRLRVGLLVAVGGGSGRICRAETLGRSALPLLKLMVMSPPLGLMPSKTRSTGMKAPPAAATMSNWLSAGAPLMATLNSRWPAAV